MSKNVIFCYSGTGNCLDLAKNIAKGLGDTDIIMMRRAPVKTDVTDAERVGFIVPCYGGGLPGDVESYLGSIKISPSAYTFAVGQYSGYLGCGLHKINERFELDLWTGMAEARRGQGEEICRHRRMHRLPPVRKALPEGQHQICKRKAELRHGLHPVPQLPAILPEGGDHADAKERKARALPQPQRLRRRAYGEHHSY